jgi:hypothetical protein
LGGMSAAQIQEPGSAAIRVRTRSSASLCFKARSSSGWTVRTSMTAVSLIERTDQDPGCPDRPNGPRRSRRFGVTAL